jgi:hypothetical protein
VESAGIRCPGCGTGACAVFHAWRFRKRVTDLTTGEVFCYLPVCRVIFCTGATVSLLPGQLWRGRYTIPSVLKTFRDVVRDGVEAACVRASEAGDGEELVSPRSLYRWNGLVRQRLLGSALSWLLPQTGSSWSENQPELPQLEALFSKITGLLLADFRATFGRGLIDTAARSRSRQDETRRIAPVSHDPSCERKTGRAGSHPRSRRWPPGET